MTGDYDLVFAGAHHEKLKSHLIVADGKEAAAILFCGHAEPIARRLLVQDIFLIPHDMCTTRQPDFISWPGEALSNAIDRAEDEGLTLILIHSHPGGYYDFSRTDDESDRIAIGSIFAGWSGPAPAAGHGSAIMVGSGHIRARLYQPDLVAKPVARVIVAGDTIAIWNSADPAQPPPMAFGSGMTRQLGDLHACIIGVSGTGSIIAEQAARMGFGRLTLIDFDRIEPKNLNRILNSSAADAKLSRLKVDIVAEALQRIRPEIEIRIVPANIFSRDAVMASATADILFSCVDSSEGRQIADLIANAFLIPLIDMGVTIPTRRLADGSAAIVEVMGRIDYVQPLGSSLSDRGVYTPQSLRAEYLARADPEAFAAEQREGYIKGAPEEAPSVIALNMRAASAAMLEFIARMFPFRHEANRTRARTLFALADGDEEFVAEDQFERHAAYYSGRGASEPLLGLPALG
jgi:hypothetical protein